MSDTPVWLQPRTCPDCQSTPGTLHGDGCDTALCAVTGQQRLLSCGESGDRPEGDCEYEPGTDCRTLNTGLWPGVVECEEYGWIEDDGPHGPWPNLNRVTRECDWNRDLQRFVRRTGQ